MQSVSSDHPTQLTHTGPEISRECLCTRPIKRQKYKGERSINSMKCSAVRVQLGQRIPFYPFPHYSLFHHLWSTIWFPRLGRYSWEILSITVFLILKHRRLSCKMRLDLPRLPYSSHNQYQVSLRVTVEKNGIKQEIFTENKFLIVYKRLLFT